MTDRVYGPVESSDGVIRFSPLILSNTQTNLMMTMITQINDDNHITMTMITMMAVTMTTIMPAKLFYHYYNLHVTLFPCWLQTKTTCGILDQWQYIFAHGDTVRAEWSLKTSTFPSYWYYLTFVLLFAPKIHILPLSYLSPSGYPLHSDSAHPLCVPEWFNHNMVALKFSLTLSLSLSDSLSLSGPLWLSLAFSDSLWLWWTGATFH